MWSEHFCGSCSFSGIFFGDRSNMPAAYLRIVYIVARDDGYKISREEFLLSPPKNLGGRTFSPKKLDSSSKKKLSKTRSSLRNWFDKEIKNEIFLSFGKRSYFPIERGSSKVEMLKNA